MADITLWKPEAEIIAHQAIGKLLEELGELTGVAARILIQGLDSADPKTGKPNREALAEEATDVTAAIAWLQQLGHVTIVTNRAARKLGGYLEWQALLEVDRDSAAISADTDASSYGAAFGTDATLPLALHPDECGVVIDADGRHVFTVDVNREWSDDEAARVARQIVSAVNGCGGPQAEAIRHG